MRLPDLGPMHLELEAMGLEPVDIKMSHEAALSVDSLFCYMAERYDLQSGLPISDGRRAPVTVNGVVHEDCQLLYLHGDCALADYDYVPGTGRLNIVVFRKDLAEIVRPIPVIPKHPIAASINGYDIANKYRAVDDVLRTTQGIIDRA